LHHLANLLRRQAAEELELHDPALARIHRLEPAERFVQVNDVYFRRDARFVTHAQRHALHIAAALPRDVFPCMVDEHAPHHHRGQAHELCPIPPVHLSLIDQPEIGLVHERRRLQRVGVALTRQVATGKPPELLIHERKQFLPGPALPLAQGD
jgi:hypothetical protein